MALTKTLTYEVLDVDGKIKSNSSISVNLKSSDGGSKHLLHKVLVIQGLQRRQGTVSSKTRSEVKGGGKKPWKQKGTGRARSGSSNSPLWKGGGVAFGPKPKSFDRKLNIKEKRLGLTTALCCVSSKLTVVENSIINVQVPGTKDFTNRMQKLGFLGSDARMLLVVHENSLNLMLSTRNIPNLTVLNSKTLNVKDVLVAKKILITEEALSTFVKM